MFSLLNPRSAVVKGFGCRPSLTCAAVPRAGGRKPPKKEPAGAGERFAVYGDLIERRLGRGMRGPALLRADWRWPSRMGSLLLRSTARIRNRSEETTSE